LFSFHVGSATSSTTRVAPPATVTADAAARAARASAGDIVSSLVMQERFVEATEAVHDMEAREKLQALNAAKADAVASDRFEDAIELRTQIRCVASWSSVAACVCVLTESDCVYRRVTTAYSKVQATLATDAMKQAWSRRT
jgi:hypothetical protein